MCEKKSWGSHSGLSWVGAMSQNFILDFKYFENKIIEIK